MSTSSPLKTLNCINLGGSLVEIRSKWEEEWIALHIRVREYDEGVWLGFNDLQNEGQFIAMSDAKEPLYTNWGSTEPNNGLLKDEHCVMYWPKYKCWNDSNCTMKGQLLRKLCAKYKANLNHEFDNIQIIRHWLILMQE
uniref:Low affinity immunoglobulin epsilon Fc receptor n=1 Tax=Magallana gigas TaxID=29159 RepID=K1Q6D3_MAGGI